jgi:UDP-N-acetylglucosamine transferase subunit ALG13
MGILALCQAGNANSLLTDTADIYRFDEHTKITSLIKKADQKMEKE